MKPGKVMLLILLILSNSILLCGCWNYVDIEKLSIVTGIAVDKNQQGDQYLLTLELIDFEMSGKDAKQSAKHIESEGKTMFDAVRNVLNLTGQKMYWAHANIIIISQDIAKEGLVPVIDFINRDAEVREEMYILVSTDKTAKEVLQQEMLLSQSSADNIEKIMNRQSFSGKAKPVRVIELVRDIEESGIAVTLPTIHLVQNTGKITAEINGTAIFKSDKLVGFLDLHETRAFLYVVNKLTSGVTTMNEDSINQMDDISLEISKSKTKVKPNYYNGKLTMNIDIKQKVNIAEIGTFVDYVKEDNRNKLKKDAENNVKASIEKLIKKVQNEYDTDIFGFGKLVKVNIPSVWKRVEPDWDKVFKELPMNISIDIQIKNSALVSKTITKGD